MPVTGIAVSTVEPLCFTDRGLAYVAHVCWRVLVNAQLNLMVLLKEYWHITAVLA